MESLKEFETTYQLNSVAVPNYPSRVGFIDWDELVRKFEGVVNRPEGRLRQIL
jgi:hypothetical protein